MYNLFALFMVNNNNNFQMEWRNLRVISILSFIAGVVAISGRGITPESNQLKDYKNLIVVSPEEIQWDDSDLPAQNVAEWGILQT